MRKITVFIMSLIIMAAAYADTFSFNAGTGDAAFDLSLNDINIEAHADLETFTGELTVTYGVPKSQIEVMVREEKIEPAEVYLILETAKSQEIPVEKVITVYKKNRGKGWGVTAMELGIKPGSKKFMELKNKADERKGKKSKKNKSKGEGKGNKK